MIPKNASPVLKSKVVFTIMTGFPFPINKDDFTVNFTLKALGAGVSPYYTHS